MTPAELSRVAELTVAALWRLGRAVPGGTGIAGVAGSAAAAAP